MRFDKFTIKSQELIQNSQTLASQYGHQQFEPEHLLAAMLQEIEQILYDDAAFVPYHWQNHSYGAKKNIKVKPIINSQNFPYFGDLVIE